jgi:TctA family transporter
MIFFKHPISLVFIVVAVASFILPLLRSKKKEGLKAAPGG